MQISSIFSVTNTAVVGSSVLVVTAICGLLVYFTFLVMLRKRERPSRPEVPRRLEPEKIAGPVLALRHHELHRVPTNINHMQHRVPYYIGVSNRVSDLLAFQEQRMASDFFIPVIGATGVGKTSFIRALLDMMDQNDDRLPIGNTGNATKELVVVAYQGGARDAPARREPDTEVHHLDGTAQLADLYVHYGMVSGCAILVLDTTLPSDRLIDEVRHFLRTTNYLLLVVVNNKMRYEDQANKQFIAIRRRLLETELISAENQVVMVTANVERRDVSIGAFKSALQRMLRDHSDHINRIAEQGEVNHFLTTPEGQQQVEEAKRELRTWTRFLSSLPRAAGIVASTTAATGFAWLFAITTFSIPAVPVAVSFLAWTGVSVDFTTFVAGGLTRGAFSVSAIIKEVNSRDAVALVRKRYLEQRRQREAAGNRPPRVFLMDTPGHGIARTDAALRDNAR